MKKRYTKREQQEHLENWEEGGMSKNAYAIASGISPRTFIGWTWRTEKPTKKKQNFVEIKKAMLVDPPRDMVIERGDITIRLPLTVGMKEMQTVFMALGGIQ